MLSPSPTPAQGLLVQKNHKIPLLSELWVQAPQKCHEVLPPSAGSGRDGPRLEGSRTLVFQRCPFQNNLLFLWPREKTLAELKQQVATLKSSIAKEEERVADLKLKTDDQAHPEIKARGITCALNGSSPPASSILGKKQTGVALGGPVLLLSSGDTAWAGLGHGRGSKLG